MRAKYQKRCLNVMHIYKRINVLRSGEVPTKQTRRARIGRRMVSPGAPGPSMVGPGAPGSSLVGGRFFALVAR
jgi:hypothetical protein